MKQFYNWWCINAQRKIWDCSNNYFYFNLFLRAVVWVYTDWWRSISCLFAISTIFWRKNNHSRDQFWFVYDIVFFRVSSSAFEFCLYDKIYQGSSFDCVENKRGQENKGCQTRTQYCFHHCLCYFILFQYFNCKVF